MKCRKHLFGILLLACGMIYAQNVVGQRIYQPIFAEKFSGEWQPVGRGLLAFENEVLKSHHLFVATKGKSWENPLITFSARAAEAASEVQIWSGFHFADRDTRYALGLRGGNCDDLYLCRYQPGGKNKMLALEPLDFSPQPGEWYQLRVEMFQGRIRVFLNDEKQPRIDLQDDAPLAAGSIVIGGGWMPAEFKDVTIRNLAAGEAKNWPEIEESSEAVFDAAAKEKQRSRERSAYRAIQIKKISAGRTSFSLDGDWLFQPEYEAASGDLAAKPSISDQNWHILPVPAFWNPARNWLHLQESPLPHPGSGVSDNYWQKEMARCEGYSFDFRKTTGGWYRQWIDLPPNLAGKRIKLYFEAISKVADLWVNGQYISRQVGMFGDWLADITDAVRPGPNLIALRVRVRLTEKAADAEKVVGRAVSVDITNDMLNSLPHGMFHGNEGGIWQPVTLQITDEIYISDVFANVRANGGQIEIEIKNEGETSASIQPAIGIRSEKTGDLLLEKKLAQSVTIAANASKTVILETGDIAPETWSPESPNLYQLTTRLLKDEQIIDEKNITTGFRTFEMIGGQFYLNGSPYWLRGANHPPGGIAPNDAALANRFFTLMHENNQMITRSHGAPFTRTWMEAADRQGIGISYEGTWPWMMIGDMPATELTDIWAEEMIRLVKKYRNHPSLLIWTMNNEMYFTMFNHNKPAETRLKKWQILSAVIKKVRKLSPNCLISCDSGYSRVQEDYEKNLAPYEIDDGDIDDRHIYPGWYNRDFYQFTNGEWAKRIYWSPGANPDRAFFSQEASTGYPNNDTGHFTRKYIYKHYVPQALVGDWAYEDKDPQYGLRRHAFLSKELAETIRRASPETAGLLLFANVCWYQNAFQTERIKPYPIVEAVKHAYEPILISAELFGRHAFAGEKMSPRICIVNNNVSGKALQNATLVWEITYENQILSSGKQSIENVPHHDRKWLETTTTLPEKLPHAKIDAQFRLYLKQEEEVISQNKYNLVIATENWVTFEPPPTANREPSIAVYDPTGESIPALKKANIPIKLLQDLTQISLQKMDLLIIANLDADPEVPYNWEDVTNIARNGTPVLLLHPGIHLPWLLPGTVASVYERSGRMVNMRIPESGAFIDIEPLELSFWQGEKRETPIACRRSFRLKHEKGIRKLATYLRPHVYLGNPVEQLPEMSGIPLLEIQLGKSRIIASEMEINHGDKNPIAARLLKNLVEMLLADTN